MLSYKDSVVIETVAAAVAVSDTSRRRSRYLRPHLFNDLAIDDHKPLALNPRDQRLLDAEALRDVALT